MREKDLIMGLQTSQKRLRLGLGNSNPNWSKMIREIYSYIKILKKTHNYIFASYVLFSITEVKKNMKSKINNI